MAHVGTSTWIAGALAALTCWAAPEARLERPVGLIVAGDHLSVARPGRLTALTVGAGAELFPGDQITTTAPNVEIAFCPARKLYRFPVPIRVAITDALLTPDPAAPLETSDADICMLPRIERVSWARNARGLPSPTEAVSLDTALMALDPVVRQQLLPKLEPVVARLARSPNDLLALVARATLLEEAGGIEAAAAEFRHIAATYPSAAWTRQVIARLDDQRLYSTGSVRGRQQPAAPVHETLETGPTFAFIVGISRYRQVESLEFADRDAELFARYLQSPRGGSLGADHLRLLLNEQATMPRISAELLDFLPRAAGKSNTLILFVAAHGRYICTNRAPGLETCPPEDETPYLLTHDSQPQDPSTSGFPMSEFYRMITAQASSFRRVLVYFDVCHGGVLGSLPADTSLPTDAVDGLFAAQSGDVGIMMASSHLKPQDRIYEYAYEDRQFGGGHGIFTYWVVRGLNADVPARNNRVQFLDLFEHTSRRVRETEPRQVPSRQYNRQDLPVVLDATKPGIAIPPMGRGTRVASRRRRAPAPPDPEVGPAAATAPDPAAQRIQLEEAGQQVVVRYLIGEDLPQTAADFERCAQAFGAAARLAPDSVFNESRRLFCQGRALIFHKRYADAEDALQRSIHLDPNRSYAYNALGIAYLEQTPADPHNLDRAIAAFTDAIRFAPYWAYPRHNLALAFEQRGDRDLALAAYQQARRLAPASAYVPYSIGLLFQRMNRLEDAQTQFQTAVRLGPAWPRASDAYNGLGVVAELQDRYKTARSHFEHALRLDPDNLLAGHNLALLESEHLRQPDLPVQRWQRILSREPDNFVALMSLADHFARYGRRLDAIAAYHKLLEHHPSSVAAHRALAVLYVGNGADAEALEHMDAALRLQPGNRLLEADREDILRIPRGLKPITPEFQSAAKARRKLAPGGTRRD